MTTLGKFDLRVTAADVPEEAPLIPEVLPPEGRHLKRFQRISNLLRNRAQDFAQEASKYAASVKNRQELWDAKKALEKIHDELYSYLEMIGQVEQDWEEEEFQETERKWQQRRRSVI